MSTPLSEKRPEAIASVLVFDRNGRVLLREEKMNSGISKWVIPGGHVEFGERTEDAAFREIREESALDVEPGPFLCHYEAVYPDFGYHAIIFFYSGLAPSPEKLVSEKGAPMGFFSPKEALSSLNIVESARFVLSKIVSGDFSAPKTEDAKNG